MPKRWKDLKILFWSDQAFHKRIISDTLLLLRRFDSQPFGQWKFFEWGNRPSRGFSFTKISHFCNVPLFSRKSNKNLRKSFISENLALAFQGDALIANQSYLTSNAQENWKMLRTFRAIGYQPGMYLFQCLKYSPQGKFSSTRVSFDPSVTYKVEDPRSNENSN